MPIYKNKKLFISVILLVFCIFLLFLFFLFYINNNKSERINEPTRLSIKENFQEQLDKFNDGNDASIIITKDVVLPIQYILSEDDCNKIINKDLKNDCNYYLKYKTFIDSENVNLCFRLTEEWQDICLFDIIENRSLTKNNQKNWEDCLLIEDNGLKNICLERQAIAIKDKEICLKKDLNINECIDRIIIVSIEWGDDITKCKEINTPEYFERCVGLSGQECSLLGDSDLIKQCESQRYFNTIIFHGEKKECKILPIENFKITCELYFDNNKKFIDSDGDKILDHIELSLGTNPFDKSDGAEALRHIEEEKIADDITNQEKLVVISSLNSLVIDTDADGLRDYDEVEIYKTDPLNSDSDGDGYTDGEEVKGGFNPNE